MTRIPKFLLLLVTASIAAPGAVAPAAARHALDLLLSSQFGPFVQLLTPEAKTKLTPEFLRDHVEPELQGFGSVEAVSPPLRAKSGTDDLVSFPVRFTSTTVNIQLTFNNTGMVAGLFFRTPEHPLPQLWHPAPYSRPDTFRERSVTIGSDDWKLPGTLTVPVQRAASRRPAGSRSGP